MAEQCVQLRHPVSLSKRTLNMGHKVPYVDVISDAILASPHRRLTAKEIFEHVSAKYGPMKKAETLKNTIRHTLSRYKVFRKVQRGRQKKPNWWTVDEQVVHAINQAVQEQPIAWHPELDVPIEHAIQQQHEPPHSQQFYGVQSYLPAPRPLVFMGSGLKLASAFHEPPQLYSTSYFGQPELTPAHISGMATIGTSSFQQPITNARARGSHYVISVKDFAASAGSDDVAHSTVDDLQLRQTGSTPGGSSEAVFRSRTPNDVIPRFAQY